MSEARQPRPVSSSWKDELPPGQKRFHGKTFILSAYAYDPASLQRMKHEVATRPTSTGARLPRNVTPGVPHYVRSVMSRYKGHRIWWIYSRRIPRRRHHA